MDVLDLINRIDSYMLEIARCASSTRHETSIHDRKRLFAEVAQFKNRFELYRGDPELDLPKYHPRPLPVPTPPAIVMVENSDLQQLLNVWSALRVELAWSDSHERASGFKVADATRVATVIEKLEKTCAAIEADPEIDLPDVNLQGPPANRPTGRLFPSTPFAQWS
jgi:hypothetical protein